MTMPMPMPKYPFLVIGWPSIAIDRPSLMTGWP